MKERKVIAFAEGIVTTPSSGKDGEMKDCVNLIPVNGELRNIEEPKDSSCYIFNAEDNLLYVHKVLTGEEHIVYLNASREICWKIPTAQAPGPSDPPLVENVIYTLATGEEIVKVSSMNNVLIVLTNESLSYYLWKKEALADSGSYQTFDSSEGRNINISFALRGGINTTGGGTDDPTITIENNEFAHTHENYNALFGAMHEFVSAAHEANKFVYPFFVRYALKTKDGRYICPSAPCLLIPNTGQSPMPAVRLEKDSGQRPEPIPDGDQKLYLKAFLGELWYAVKNTTADLNDIKAMIGDVVDSVVVAVTPPIYTYDDGSSSTQKKNELGFNLPYYYSVDGRTSAAAATSDAVSSNRRKIYNQYNNMFGVFGRGEYHTQVNPITGTTEYVDGGAYKRDESLKWPSREDVNVGEYYYPPLYLPYLSPDIAIKQSDVFRVVKEIKLEDLVSEDTYPVIPGTNTKRNGGTISLEIPEGYLSTLDALPRMDDDPISLQDYLPKTTFEYNSRLNLANVERTLWHGHNPVLMQGVCQKDENDNNVEVYYKATVEIVKDGSSYYVTSDFEPKGYQLYWFYYPDKDAKRVTIYRIAYNSTAGLCEITGVELSLTEHDTLNGAYWFGGYKFITCSSGTWTPLAMQGDTVQEPHTILGSEPFNPTVLSSDNVINVGKGEIKAVSAISLPISEPFGKTPMVCFCTDGVWGLSLKSDGSFAADQQLSGDILMDGTEPVQSDKAVFFITEQGLKAFTGGVPELLSGNMEQKVEYGNGSNGANVIFDFLNDVCKAGTKLMWDYAHNFLHIFPDVDVTVWIPTVQNPLPANPTAGQLMYLTANVTITDTDPVTGDSLSVTYTAGLYKYDSVWKATVLNEYVYNVRTGQFARKENGWAPGGIVQAYPVTYLQKVGVTQLYTTERNRENGVPKSGTAVTREEPFGDATAMKQLIDMRILHLFSNSTSQARVSIQVSNDRYNWYTLTSLRAHSWKWYRFVLTTSMTNEESVQGILAEYETRRGNKLR